LCDRLPERQAMLMFTGKTALITGAASGIGKSIAREFSKLGADVIINYRESAAAADHVVGELSQDGRRAVAIQADVSNQSEVKRMIQETVRVFGKIDILVNNAGIQKKTPFLDQSLADWNRIIEVDLTGPFICAQAVAGEMVKGKTKGVIVNISSVHEDIAFPNYTAYCAAKGGLRMLCRNLALELAPHGIRIVNVAPGAIATPINEDTLQDPEKKRALENEIPVGRIGEPEEVAKLVSFLASDDASYITGTTVFVDGGLMRQTGSL
jgi:glucose 1-dehydrogenase